MSSESVRVYLNGPAFHIRPANTDWQYLRLLTRLPEFVAGVSIYRERPAWPTYAFNLRYGASVLARKAGLPFADSVRPRLGVTVAAADLRRSGCNVIYSYGLGPLNASPVPVVLHAGAIDRERGLQNGISRERIAALERRFRYVSSYATLVTANSQAALDNLAALLPGAYSKLRLLPFFLPHLTPVEEAAIAAKFCAPGPIRLVFVGREARRKGLPAVLAAFIALDAAMPAQLELTVISSFDDGAISMPAMPNLHHFAELGRDSVQQLLRASHMLLMPSHFEGYGWVYLEALAAGTVAVASAAPIQNEILDHGRAGILSSPDAAKLETALAPMLRDRRAMESLALAGWRHCHNNFLPRQVAGRMKEVFLEARELGAPDTPGD